MTAPERGVGVAGTIIAGRRGVIFDLDGTLIDSEKAICAASSLAFADLGFDVDEAAVADHLGDPLDELFASFVPADVANDAGRRQRFIDRYIAHHDGHPDRDPPPLPGVVAALKGLKALGLPLAVATTKPTNRAVQQLRSCDLLGYFTHVQGTDLPLRPKPHPDVVVAAAKAIGVDPAEAVMVGDTNRDVGAAKACGALDVVVAYGPHRIAVAKAFNARHVIWQLTELLAAPRR